MLCSTYQVTSVPIRPLCQKYSKFELFFAVQQRLSNDLLPISCFVDKLSSKTVWTTAEMCQYFVSTPIKNVAISADTVFCQIPDYKQFLEKNRFSGVHEEHLDLSILIHDLVGHLLFGNLTDAEGELEACAVVMGFCPASGTDYFICALLMFSFGYQLFDDVHPAHILVNDYYARRLNAAYLEGKELRQLSEFTSNDKGTTAGYIVKRWYQLRELRASMLGTW